MCVCVFCFVLFVCVFCVCFVCVRARLSQAADVKDSFYGELEHMFYKFPSDFNAKVGRE
jgi:hypothetical protein